MNTESNNYKYLLSLFWSHISRKHKYRLFALLILMLFSSFGEILSIGALVPFLFFLTNPAKAVNSQYTAIVMKYLKITNSNEIIVTITIIFISLIIFSAILRFFTLYFQTKLSFDIGKNYCIKIYESVLNQSYAIHVKRNSSEIISAISIKANNVIFSILMPILIIANTLFVSILILLTLFIVNPFITLLSIICFGSIYYIISLFVKKKLLNDSKIISIESNNVIKSLQEGLGSIRDIILNDIQKSFLNSYRYSDLRLKNSQCRTLIIGGTPRFIIETIGIVLISILAFYLSYIKNGFAEALPTLGALALAAQRVLPILQQAFNAWTNIKSHKGSLSDTLNLIDRQTKSERFINNASVIKFENQIIFKNVSFRYNDTSNFIFNDLNLTINKNDKIGIVGPTGCGKSTFIDLLMGLLLPTNGSISIDNVNLCDDTIKNWQKLFSHVPQNIYLLDSTIAENIAFGVDKELINYHKIEECLNKAQLNETISNWKDNYNTIVGERGVMLSGGQLQRIGIARALYKNSDILIFDEATSALDDDTEEKIIETIDSLSKDMTIVFIAHRISTLKSCNKIIKFSFDKPIEVGTFESFFNQTTNPNKCL